MDSGEMTFLTWGMSERQLSKRQGVSDKGAVDIQTPIQCYNELPLEIIQMIVSYIREPTAENQKTLWACCLVRRSWWHATVPQLYRYPVLDGHNFERFVPTICPSVNAHIRRSPLASYVKMLDMSHLVHDGSKSLTARMLGRLKGNLAEFVAPQASFSINSFASLAKCTKLRYLNLQLMSASIPNAVLFKALGSLVNLEELLMPRTSPLDQDRQDFAQTWPPKLRKLHIAGGVDNVFLLGVGRAIPKSVVQLSIQHCPRLSNDALSWYLECIGPQLRELTLGHPLAGMHRGGLNPVLLWCPNLLKLRISVDFITETMLTDVDRPYCHPLQVLDLDCSPTDEIGFEPDSLWLAIDENVLPNLRSVRVTHRLAWTATERLRTSVSDIKELMLENEKENPTGIKVDIIQYVYTNMANGGMKA